MRNTIPFAGILLPMNPTPMNLRRDVTGKLPLCLAAAAVSAVMLWFGTGLHPIWWLTWIAMLPVLLLAPRVGQWPAQLTALLAWTIGGLNELTYMHRVEVPLSVALAAIIGPALVFDLAVMTWRALVLRGDIARAAMAFASTWVVFEFALQRLSPHSTFGSIAYSQLNCLPILQVASLAGLAGISFLLFLIPGTIAAVTSGRGTRREKFALAGSVAALLAATVVWGTWRLKAAPWQQGAAPRVLVGLVASDLPQNVIPELPDDKKRLFAEYASQANQLVADGAQIVIVPEKIARIYGSSIGIVDAPIGAAARNGAVIVIGVARWTPSTKLNEARVYAFGELYTTYEKHHMLPAFESDMLPGTTRAILQQPSGKWGIEICKDMDFPALSRQYGNDGAGLVLVPAWDFVMDGWLHDRMAVVRGVESGFSIVRAAKQGLLTVSDDRGRILAEQHSDSADFATLLAAVPVRHDATLYDRWGDWFSWLNVLAFAVVCIGRFRPGSPRASPPA
jgi:apolipoprotein N-acyltransferase